MSRIKQGFDSQDMSIAHSALNYNLTSPLLKSGSFQREGKWARGETGCHTTKEMREKVPEPKTDEGVKDIPNAKGFHAQDGALKETIKNEDVI